MGKDKLDRAFAVLIVIVAAFIVFGFACVEMENRTQLDARQREIEELADTVEHLQRFIEINIGPVWK